jgi:tripartite-type tricarboxylate transporter receptor subunit TctC
MDRLKLTTALIGMAFAGAAALPAAAQDGYFAGKDIEVVVPFAPGGATYVSAKFLEPFFERHLPGNPTVTVVDRPGGGSILGANWFEENARDDGTTVLFTTSSTSNPYVLGQSEVAYDLAAYRVAYSHAFGSVIFVSPDIGVETAADLPNATSPLIYGGIAAAASDLPAVLSFEVLDLDVNAVMGFSGRGPTLLAFQRGETNLEAQFTPVYMTQVVPMVEEGSAIPVYTGGSIAEDGRLSARDSVAPDLPSVFEAHQAIHGEEPSGIEWDAFQAIATSTYAFGLTGYLHPDAPDEAVQAFADGVAAINADPEFIEGAREITGGTPLMAGIDIEDDVRAALQPSDEVRAYLRDLLADKFGVSF